ncbi:MAG: phage virion morphogenesis protein [Proteobacteria bacterium]|nr:phage virion morphogenesis protein [Pseudomonadota bacterium]
MQKFEVDPGGKAAAQLSKAAQQLADATPLFRSIAGLLERETEANFAAQGRPSWVPLSASTKAERLRRNKGGSVLKILQDRGILAASISSAHGPDFALVGAGGAAKDYAAIHQFGGTVDVPAHSVKTRLRTDAKGGLVRQQGHQNLAVFAKEGHKRVRESWSTVDAHKVQIPARPYLPFSGPAESATLQPEVEGSLLDLIERHLQASTGG